MGVLGYYVFLIFHKYVKCFFNVLSVLLNFASTCLKFNVAACTIRNMVCEREISLYWCILSQCQHCVCSQFIQSACTHLISQPKLILLSAEDKSQYQSGLEPVCDSSA